MVVESEERFQERIAALEAALQRAIRQKFDRIRVSLRDYARALGDPRRRLEQYAQRVDELSRRLATGLMHHVRRDRALLLSLTSALGHLNPLGILSRGYSITKILPAGTILKDASQAAPGDLLLTKLHEGDVISRVEKAEVKKPR
jgi:exodeoxyribonuclease VII large subunit